MSRVVVITDSVEVAAAVERAVGGPVSRMPATPPPPPPGPAAEPMIVVLSGPSPDADLALATDLDRAHYAVIMMTAAAEQVALAALKTGVIDVLPPDAGVSELLPALLRADLAAQAKIAAAAQQRAAANPGAVGRVVTVASPKGGVGKTTVATNLAVGLATRVPNGVVLVDLDLHFGDVATALSLTPTYTLPDVVTGSAVTDAIALKTLLTQHPSGLFVVPGSDSPAAADAVTAHDVSALLRTLASAFAYVVVDTSPGLSEHTLAALDQTNDLVLVTSLDVPGVRGLRKEIETLKELELFMDSRQIVLNFHDDHRGISIADVEATVGEKVDVVIPLAREVPLSVNQGIPLLHGTGRDAASRPLRQLVDLIAGPGEQPTGGLLARLRKKA